MEKKKKDHKIASGASQEPEMNLLSKEDQNQPTVAPAGKNHKMGSPSHENIPSLNQQYPPIIQWSYPTLHAEEQPSLVSRPCVGAHSNSPNVVNQWQPSTEQQMNPGSYQVQQPPHLTQSSTPFWLHQRPTYHLSGLNAPAAFQPFTPIGTVNGTWQAPAVNGGGTLSRNQPQMPNICYHFGFPYPGFPGTWDRSYWWAQGQYSQPSCTYTLPGAYGYLSSPTLPMPGCSASIGQSFHRGMIRPTAKLSQKHQQLWEAQSAENVQLWAVISQLQSEIADYKSRLLKLEAEISSLKPAVEEPAAQITGTVPAQASKRGRPKRSVASVDMQPSPAESHPRARGRKPALYKVQPESRKLSFEKTSINKVEDKEKVCHSIATIHQGKDGEVPNTLRNFSDNIDTNRSSLMMPAFNNQIHQGVPGIRSVGTRLNSSSQTKGDADMTLTSRSALIILSQQAKVIDANGASATYTGTTNNGNLGWPANMNSGDSQGNMLNLSSQSFYDNGSMIRQGGKVIPGWTFVNEEGASEELEDTAVGSGKDENEGEMGDDASSGAEETGKAKDESAYNMDGVMETSPKGLPQFNNW